VARVLAQSVKAHAHAADARAHPGNTEGRAIS
jgi:hypothetical protein